MIFSAIHISHIIHHYCFDCNLPWVALQPCTRWSLMENKKNKVTFLRGLFLLTTILFFLVFLIFSSESEFGFVENFLIRFFFFCWWWWRWWCCLEWWGFGTALKIIQMDPPSISSGNFPAAAFWFKVVL